MTDTPRTSRRGRFIQALFTIGDLIIVNLILWLTMALMSLSFNPMYIRELWLIVNVAFIPMALIMRNQGLERRAIRMERVMRSTLVGVAAHLVSLLTLQAFLHMPYLANKVYLTYYLLMLVALMTFRIGATYALKNYRRKGYNFVRVVIVGNGPTGQRLIENMQKDSGYGYRIIAIFDDAADKKTIKGIPVLPLEELEKFVKEHEVRQIFFTHSGHDPSMPKVIKIADDNVAEFYYVPQIPNTFSRPMDLSSIGLLPVLAIRRNPLKGTVNRCVKRAFDIVVSSVFLCFYPLVYIPVAIGIKLSSPGPVYFKQERTGYLGKSFTCLKFRTMRVNAASDSCQATAHDPRKTRIGDFLRRTSIDELPQFINVWKGDMSIVGPRPHMLKHTEDYTRVVDRYMVRHTVKPGITGWAQVNGYRGITDQLWKMERRVEHDVWYIENWTLLLDIKIMIRTVMNALHGESNAF